MSLQSLHEKFNRSAAVIYPERVTIPGGVINTHGHPRNPEEDGDGRANMMVPLYAEAFTDVMGMGNTTVPLTTSMLAHAMGTKWRSLIPPKYGKNLRIHVAGLMTETTNAQDVIAGYDTPLGSEAWIAMKMFIRAASNAHGADVDDLSKAIPVIKAMAETNFQHKETPMPLSVHAERKFTIAGERIFFLDRNKASMDRDITRIFNEVPRARVIICHVNSAYAVNMIRTFRKLGFDIWGEISPHYTMYTCDDLFEGPDGGTAFNAHRFCLPIFGKVEDRDAVLGAMLSGEPFWFYGDDGACHWDLPTLPKGVKVNSAGYVLGGQAQIPRATVSYVIEKFVEAGKLEFLNDFLSLNGRRAFHLPLRQISTTFKRYDWPVPDEISHISPTRGKMVAKVAMGGQTRKYWPETDLS